ncbi:MAG: hypothetical protein ACTSQO_12975 [Candidatus Helarchaeota archaeon]
MISYYYQNIGFNGDNIPQKDTLEKLGRDFYKRIVPVIIHSSIPNYFETIEKNSSRKI